MNAELDLSGLRGSLAGDVLAPEDSGYDGARRCYNALIDRRPAVIARCLGADDIAAAFDFARSNALEVAVRGGGHNPSGHCVCDGGLVIDMTLMREVEVDPEARVARSQGGATWLDFDAATQAFGMAAPGGIVGSTGVAGLALGGGIGHLTAQRGLTCDNLVGAELVTPEGSVVRTSDDENPDLLWALRGAGGNFGVATELEFRLESLDRVVGGRLTYRGDGVGEALRRFRDLVASSPRELSCQTVLSVDDEMVPVLVVTPCYSGDGTVAQIEDLRRADGLVSDAVRDHTFLDQQRVVDPPYGADRNYWKGQFVRELPDELIDLLVERIQALDRPPGEILIESLHGAAKDVDGDTAALGWREAGFNVSAMGVWLDPEADDRHIAWARETAAAIEPWSLGGGYVNYMQADEPIERVRAAFGEPTFDRLQELKRRYDPDNVLRRNQNIPPA
jgi:FAD/FMN-containing dehydrogenase